MSSASCPGGINTDARNRSMVHFHPVPTPQPNAKAYVSNCWLGWVKKMLVKSVVPVSNAVASMELTKGLHHEGETDRPARKAPGILPTSSMRIAIPFSVEEKSKVSV